MVVGGISALRAATRPPIDPSVLVGASIERAVAAPMAGSGGLHQQVRPWHLASSAPASSSAKIVSFPVRRNHERRFAACCSGPGV
jgi:hypothetical protein